MPNQDLNHLKPFRYYTQFILPLSYDDSLSYYEVLAKVTTKLNEVIEWANNYRDDLKAYVDQKTLENLTQMQNMLAEYKTTVDGQLANMQAQLDGILTQVNQIIKDFEAKLNAFQTDITNQFNQFKTEITQQIAENEAWVKAQILKLQAEVNSKLALVYSQMEINKEFNKLYTDSRIEWLINHLQEYLPVPVISPITGRLEPIQTVLYQITEAARVWACTCGQYDLLALTCQEYDDLNLTCWNYDWFAWYKLGPYRFIHRCFSEDSGRFLPIQRVIHEIYQRLRVNGITAGAYDNLALSCDAYDELQLTAYAYNWEAFPQS